MSGPEPEVKEPNNYYSIEEVREQLSNLTDAELTKLQKIAQSYIFDYNLNTEDLLFITFEKVYDGSRNWPKNLKVLKFFQNTMQSVLDNELKKVKEELLLNSPNEDGEEPINSIPDNSAGIENKIITEQEIDNIFSLFNDDKIAKELIEGRMENLNKKELLELLNLTDVEYESKLKKIRRRISKKYPKGIDL